MIIRPGSPASLLHTMTVLVLAASALNSGAAEPDAKLKTVLDRHRSSIDALATYECEITYKLTVRARPGRPEYAQECIGHYWATSEAVRFRAIEGGEVADAVWQDGVRLTLSARKGGSEVAAGRGAHSSPHTHWCDPCQHGLLVVNRPGTIELYRLEEAVKLAKTARLVSFDPSRPIDIEMTFGTVRTGDWTAVVTVDPAVNHLIRKVHYWSGTYHRYDDVVEFAEPAPGVFFPAKLAARSVDDNGTEWTSGEGTLTKIRVNQPIPASTFQLPFRAGMMMTDSIDNASYKIDATGKPISPRKRLGAIPPPPIAAAPAPADPAPVGATRVEPEPRSRWLLPASAAGAVAALGLLARRRWAERRGEA